MPVGLSGVKAIYSTDSAFAALGEDGTVAAWGHSDYGGSAPSGLSEVKAIYSTRLSRCCPEGRRHGGSVGDAGYGVPGGACGLSGVKAIYILLQAASGCPEGRRHGGRRGVIQIVEAVVCLRG